MRGKSLIFAVIAAGILMVLIAGIYHFIGVAGNDTLPVSVSNATTDVTKNYDAIDFRITRTVKNYHTAVFDIGHIRNTVETEGVPEIRIDGRERRIPLEKSEIRNPTGRRKCGSCAIDRHR